LGLARIEAQALFASLLRRGRSHRARRRTRSAYSSHPARPGAAPGHRRARL